MRRPLLAVPVVLALGAGGYLVLRGGSRTAPASTREPAPPTAIGTTRGDRSIDPSAPIPAPAPMADPSQTTPAPPLAGAGFGSAPAGSTPAGSEAGSAELAPPDSVARFEQTHGSGATRPRLPVPVRGSETLQKHLGAMAQCQGPEYAAMTGQARVDYAKRCAKAGVTLPP